MPRFCSHLSLLLALPLSACGGPITNALFLEDAEFVAALPTEERTTVRFEVVEVDLPAGPRPPGAAPDLLDFTRDVSEQVNGFVFQVLTWVDEVRAYPPTEREEDVRTWGPWPVGTMLDFELLVEILREGLGVYPWIFSLRQPGAGDWRPILDGRHYAGETVAAGDGQFTADFSAMDEVMGTGDRGLVTVDYDNRDGVELYVAIEGWQSAAQAAEGQPATNALYWYRRDAAGNGDFEYAFVQDVDGAGSVESVEVRTRWTGFLAVRSDARLTGGDLAAPIELSQCWDEAGTLVYQSDTQGLFDEVGVASDCPFADAALPEHLE